MVTSSRNGKIMVTVCGTVQGYTASKMGTGNHFLWLSKIPTAYQMENAPFKSSIGLNRPDFVISSPIVFRICESSHFFIRLCKDITFEHLQLAGLFRQTPTSQIISRFVHSR